MKNRHQIVVLMLIITILTTPLSAQTRDSVAFVRAKWTIDTLDGLVLKRNHFKNNSFLQSNQYICILEVPQQSHYRLAFSHEPRRTATTAQAALHHAVAAINGSYFDMKYHHPICYLRIDGEEKGINTPQVSDSVHRKYYQYGTIVLNGGYPLFVIPDSARLAEREYKDSNIMTAGPMLIHEGKRLPMRDDKTFVTQRHNRTAIGKKADGTIVLVTVDGRTRESEGLSLNDFTTLLRWVGCCEALNLDGGGSTTMYIKGYQHGGLVTHPSDNGRFDFKGERGVSNCILVLPR